ncbi:hypothetical protein [Mycobacterium sp. 236(2023)]|uniref:hypothetical protein n=1 Tax=Mycobacterium sp. 236(2023) TaxID=3038163 RepID=UPI002415477D|nr:hypothetical protein [Mycobacterium sp. 236(2023)]MDG4667041.1 hypothetical protein [Mycobacterium sp. 236(2023)]
MTPAIRPAFLASAALRSRLPIPPTTTDVDVAVLYRAGPCRFASSSAESAAARSLLPLRISGPAAAAP